MTTGLICKACGGELHPAEGAAICRCPLCGTLQSVPAEGGEDRASPKQRETAYIIAAALEDSAETAADFLAAADAFGQAGDFRDAAKRAAGCRARAAEAKEEEKAASFQKWLKERKEREKSWGEDEPRPAGIRRQAKKAEAGREEKRPEEKRKTFIRIACAAAAVIVLAAAGILIGGKLLRPEDKNNRTETTANGGEPAETAAAATSAPADSGPTDLELHYARAEEYLAEGDLAAAAEYYRLAAGYSDAAKKLEKITVYISAEEEYGDGSLAAAREKYLGLGGFLDAEAKAGEISAALYAQAVDALEKKEYRQAETILEALGNYADCMELAQRVDGEYYTALNHWSSGEKIRAEEELQALAGWKDTGEKLAALRLEIADEAAANEDYDTALAYYEKLPFSDETENKKNEASRAKNYRDGMAALEARDFEEARRKFISAGGYLDSDRQAADLIRYRQAEAEMDAGRYEEACSLFEALGEYLDAPEKLAACESAIQQKAAEPDGGGESGVEEPDAEKEAEFRAALAYLEKGEYAEAEAILAGLAGWKEADDALEQLREEMADRAAEAGDYETAVAYYNKLANRTDEIITKLISANRGKNYREAMAALEAGDLETANAKLIAADGFRDAADQLDQLKAYRRAEAARTEGRYREARADYIGLGDYLDSAEGLEACNAALYREAAERKAGGDNAGAYELFSLISGYADSGDIAAGMDADYEAALEHIGNGEKAEAEALLAGLTGWKDTDEKLEQLREAIADEAAEAGDYDTAIAYYSKLNGRTEATEAKLTGAVRGKNYREAMAALDAGDLETARGKLTAAEGFRDAADQLEKLDIYRKANDAMAGGGYREARADYIRLGTYLDSAKLLDACNAALYREAAERKARGDNAGAYELFSLISGYADSGDIAAGMDADYSAALEHISNGEKAEAEALLSGLTGWKDTDGRLEKLREEIADEAAEAGDYDTAVTYYGRLNNRTEATEEKLAGAIRGKNYREAEAALAAGDLETAAALFTAAGEYRDAAGQAQKLAEYRKAETLKSSGSFDEAVQIYTSLDGYLDSAEQARACVYSKAEAQLAGGDPDGAAETFRSIPDYRDSAGRANALHYEKAKALWDSGDLLSARAEYEALGGYSDAPELLAKVLEETTEGYIAAGAFSDALNVYPEPEQADAVRERIYTLAQTCFDEGNYAEAAAAYEALGQYELSLSKLAAARYAWADQLFNAGEFEKAAEQFSLLGDMSDSAARANESIYQLANRYLENGEYDEGKKRFAAISGYSDADSRARECDYRKAASLYDAGEIREAQELFEALGDYSDSRARADLCIYMQAEELYRAEKYGEAKDLYGSVSCLDSREKYSECVYILADALAAEGRYAEAKEMFRSIRYRDSGERADDSAYREAEGYYAGGQYAEAEKCFLELGGYRDSADRAGDARLQQGSALMAAGDYAGALALFETAEYGNSAGLAAKCRYELGYAAHAAGKPDDAVKQYAGALTLPETEAAIMSAAKDYTAVKETEKAIQTLWLIRDRDEAGSSLMEIASQEQQAGENTLALLAYVSAGDSSLPELASLLKEVPYDAFRECVQDCTLLPDGMEYAGDIYHTYAEALFGAEMYAEAAAVFEAIGDYADAAGRAAEARYMQAKSLYDAGDYAAAYAVYRQVRGYRDTDELLASDAHLVKAKLDPYTTAGNIVTFGSYEQDNDPSNGPEAIEWIVLASQNGKTLLLSRYGLDAKPYNTKNGKTTWERCSLRAWLNGEFFQTAFSAEEQAAVETANVSNSKAQGYWHTSGGKDTRDRVFLLSCAEANKYLGVTYNNTKNEKSRTSPTAYAIAQGAETRDTVLTAEGQAVGVWWLRSPGLNEQSAAHIHNGGSLYYRVVSNASVMVRPAILLDLSSDIF